MCKVSGCLKLCTCAITDDKMPEHYWVLKSHNSNQSSIIGSAMLPANIGAMAHRLNSRTLQKALNKGNGFHVDLQPGLADILELHFRFFADPTKCPMGPCYDNYLAYAFVYKAGRWKKTDYDPFSENLTDLQSGEIENAFSSDGSLP